MNGGAGVHRDGAPTGIAGLALASVGAVGVAAALTGAFWAALMRQGRSAARQIEAAALAAARADGTLPPGAEEAVDAVPPRADGVYFPDGTYSSDATSLTHEIQPTGPRPSGRVPVLAMLGDSASLGYGCATADEVPGVVLARGAAAALQQPVALRSLGVVGSGAADLVAQIDAVTADPADPVDLAVVISGANDITNRIPPWQSAAVLGSAVDALRSAGIQVVVGTCPDFGVLAPLPQPLRSVVGTWSRQLATLQARAVAAAGGRVVAIGRLVSPEFRGRPEMFYADGFHPSAPGYAKATAALLPEVVAGLWDSLDAEPASSAADPASSAAGPASSTADPASSTAEHAAASRRQLPARSA